MQSRSLKAIQSIFLQGNFHRIWQILLKSPLVHGFAYAHSLWSPRIQKARVNLFRELQTNELQKQIVHSLQTDGFARVDSLFSTSDFEPLKEYLLEKSRNLKEAQSQQTVHTKDFWIRLSDMDFANGTNEKHPLIALSLKTELLEVVASYLKQAPYLEYVLLTHSLPSGKVLKNSQLWHQDHDNDRMVKFFIYLSDVQNIEDGPFTLLPKTANQAIKNSFFPRHLKDSEVDTQFPLSNSVQIRGPQFSAFLVDTSVCYHMGSRVAEGHSRLMSTSLYVTLPKAYWGQIKGFIRPTTDLPKLQTAAVDQNFGQN